ncbi:MAG TPA: hypothetical protein VF808_18075 [Ktedonobacterales bacterium]
MAFIVFLAPILAMTLVIPAAVLTGQRWRSGAMVASAIGALLGFLPLWAASLTAVSVYSFGVAFGYVEILLFLGGGLLLVGAWAIALERAVRQRHWWGFVLVTASALLSTGLFFIQDPYYYPCASSFGAGGCNANPPLTHAIFLGAALIGPGAILAYAWWARHARTPAPPSPPDNHMTSPLTTAGDEA